MRAVKIGKRIIRFFYRYSLLILILIFGFWLWYTVFNLAVQDYLNTNLWRTRGVWLGLGEYELFGYTIEYQMEGYTDYSFYYVHWGTNMLRGVMPYTNQFGYIELNGYVNENGAYIFPPLYAYLYAAGIAIPVDNWGIGLLITTFGYLTVFPIYGIAKELSNNRRVGEIAAFTYLITPNVLYHTVFVWLNPAPFVFCFFLGFYFLVRGRKDVGTLFIVIAALFKQTAWFLGIPLVVYLLVKPQPQDWYKRLREPTTESTGGSKTESLQHRIVRELRRTWHFLNDVFDLKGFARSAAMVVIFVLAIMFPFLLANPNTLRFMSLAGGGFWLDDTSEPPSYGVPMRISVLPVMAGIPWLAEILNLIVYYGFLLSFGVMLIMGFMFLERRVIGNETHYMRRLLYFTLLIMLWVHLMGPRGVFKYYFVIFAPFFCILSSQKMIESDKEHVSVSLSMFIVPLFLSLSILIPNRNLYLFSVIIIAVGYFAPDKVGMFWRFITAPFGMIKCHLGLRLSPYLSKARFLKLRFEYFIGEKKKPVVIGVNSG